MVPAIVADPNEFVSRLTASTSHKVGRAKLLGLCFRVAGAIQTKLRPEVMRRLVAGVLPLFHSAVVLRVPYAAEVLGYLFSQVGWQAFGRFLAEVSENPDLMPSTRKFASLRLGRVLTRDDPASAEEIAALLGEAIAPAIWADHESARKILEAEGSEDSKLGSFPLLIGGLANSVSLSLGEKLRIVMRLGWLTPNVLGQLQMIFIEEASAFGTLAIIEERHNSQLLGLYSDYRAQLQLHKADALLVQGELLQAIAAFFEVWPSTGAKQPLLERLVRLSAEMTRDQLRRLEALLRAHKAEVCGWVDAASYSIVARILREPRVHSSIRGLIEELQAETQDLWLVFWFGALLGGRSCSDPDIVEKFEDLAPGFDWKTSDGLLLLGLIGNLGGSSVQKKVAELMELHYPERPSLKIRQLTANLKSLPGERVVSETLEQLVRVGFQSQFVDWIFGMVLEGFDVETAQQFIEDLGGYDQTLQFHARILLATKIAEAGDREAFDSLMTRWGTTIGDFARKASVEVPFLRAVTSMGEHSVVLSVLGWRGGKGIDSSLTPGESSSLYGGRCDRLDLIASLLEESSEPTEALAAVFAGIKESKAEGRDPRSFANRAIRLINKPDTTELKAEANALFADHLLPLLGDPTDTSWVVERLEALRASGDLDMGAYVQRLSEVLRSPYARLGASRNTALLKILSVTGHHEEVLRCLEAYVRACPRDPARAVDYLGSGAWYAYLAGDNGRFGAMTDSALSLAPEGNRQEWLLGNRALCLALSGQFDQALGVYAEARAVVTDRERWQHIAVDDLEQHHIRRADSDPIDATFIAKVRDLGADLPEAPVEPATEQPGV